jgi:hypothetical protein
MQETVIFAVCKFRDKSLPRRLKARIPGGGERGRGLHVKQEDIFLIQVGVIYIE